MGLLGRKEATAGYERWVVWKGSDELEAESQQRSAWL